MLSLSRVELLRMLVAAVLRILLASEEFWQRARFTFRLRRRRAGIVEAQRLRQPARATQETLGLFGHVGLLQMVDQLRRRLALGFPQRLQNARLSDAADVVVDFQPACTMSTPAARASTLAWSRRVRTPWAETRP